MNNTKNWKFSLHNIINVGAIFLPKEPEINDCVHIRIVGHKVYIKIVEIDPIDQHLYFAFGKGNEVNFKLIIKYHLLDNPTNHVMIPPCHQQNVLRK